MTVLFCSFDHTKNKANFKDVKPPSCHCTRRRSAEIAPPVWLPAVVVTPSLSFFPKIKSVLPPRHPVPSSDTHTHRFLSALEDLDPRVIKARNVAAETATQVQRSDPRAMRVLWARKVGKTPDSGGCPEGTSPTKQTHTHSRTQRHTHTHGDRCSSIVVGVGVGGEAKERWKKRFVELTGRSSRGHNQLKRLT